MCSLSGFWPVQSLDGTRTRLLLCLEPLCRCGHNHGPCSCSSFHLCDGQAEKRLQKVTVPLSTPPIHHLTYVDPPFFNVTSCTNLHSLKRSSKLKPEEKRRNLYLGLFTGFIRQVLVDQDSEEKPLGRSVCEKLHGSTWVLLHRSFTPWLNSST